MLYNEKPYYSFDYYLKQTFGQKVYKLSLNGGMTCPNRDGKLGDKGCIFCSAGGSGDFAAPVSMSIAEQIQYDISLISKKFPAKKYIAYFQAYTNTYGPVNVLRDKFMQAISHPDVAALSIATRPDCFSPEIFDLISELNCIKPVWIELGLQTIHENTARYIRRGYKLPCFEAAVSELRKRKIDTIVHVILGLPGETEEEVIQTIRYLNKKDIQGIKLQLLHVLENTDLAIDYRMGKFKVLSMEQYVNLVIECIEELSPDIVIHRLTGDGPKDILIAPLWSCKKMQVLNEIHHRMKILNSYQGKNYNRGQYK